MYDTTSLQQFTALEPIVFENSTVLFLVSMPSVKSEEHKLYFGDPANHFWPVLGAIYNMPYASDEEKLAICQTHGIAIWSVVKSCLRHMSREDTMRDIVLNDINGFLQAHPSIQKIICVSHGAQRLLNESNFMENIPVEYVPSPSGADLDYESVDRLAPRYKEALENE